MVFDRYLRLAETRARYSKLVSTWRPWRSPAFLVGLLGGVHCVAMCGGIVGALNLPARRAVLSAAGGGTIAAGCRRAAPLHLAYSAGRIASYAAAGAIAGGVGGIAALPTP